jgi:lysophospholipase L1-like esterase
MGALRQLRAAATAIALAFVGCVRAPEPAAEPHRPVAAPIAAPPTSAAFAAEIAAFEAADRRMLPSPGGIVFTGSSSIRLWPDLAAAFGRDVVPRGFGGSTLPDVIHYAPRIVLPLRPRQVVLYAGDNDISHGHGPEQVLSDYLAFMRLLRAQDPTIRIVYISIKPSPSRWASVERMRTANALIASAIAGDSLAAFVDVFSPMLGENGRPRPELFLADSLHMTAAGYALWRERVAPHLR